MARRNFPGKSQTWLEARLEEVLDEQASGKVTSNWGAGDSNVGKTLDNRLDIQTRKNLLLYDLSLLDPDQYPPADVQPVKRTQAVVHTPGDEA